MDVYIRRLDGDRKPGNVRAKADFIRLPRPMIPDSFKRSALGIIWLTAATVGLAVALNYENTAGRTGETPRHWPAETSVALDSKRDTLLMFVHPQCPCTRASLEELNRLLARCQGQVITHVLFFKPGHSPGDWTST